MVNLFIIANRKIRKWQIQDIYEKEFTRNLIDESINQLYLTYKTIFWENLQDNFIPCV